jgi:hypothetical protein
MMNPVMEEDIDFNCVPEINGERNTNDMNKIDEMFMSKNQINKEY